MKSTGLVVVALAALTLSACAGRAYDRDRHYYSDRYGPGPGGGVYYSDLNPNDRYYTDYPNREYRDRAGRRYGNRD